jgi:MFS transporter, PAT family, beta-lactamase induction signal transducer AmpG
MLEVFRSHKMAALMLLGFSSGLPLYLTSRTLQAWLTTEGVNLSTIGFFSLAGLPYSMKFLWSPFLDRYSFPILGRRKGWLIVSQAALALAIGGIAAVNPASNLQLFAAIAFAIAFMSATQDITVDAYRADILEPKETGAGAGIGVLGYRLAMILTGSIALILADYWAWPTVYIFLAIVMIALLIASLWVPEPPDVREPLDLRDAVRMPFVEFFQRIGAMKAIIVLGFIVLYRLGDSMISNLTTPFLLQIGFTQSDVGAIQGGVGLISTIFGVLAGGAILSRIGINKSLWIFGALQALSNLGYFALSHAGRNYSVMVGTIVIENICTGLGTAAFVGFLISLCNPSFSATQYALLSSLMAVGRDVVVSPTGMLAQAAGWPTFFMISFFAAVPGLLLLMAIAPWNASKERG